MTRISDLGKLYELGNKPARKFGGRVLNCPRSPRASSRGTGHTYYEWRVSEVRQNRRNRGTNSTRKRNFCQIHNWVKSDRLPVAVWRDSLKVARHSLCGSSSLGDGCQRPVESASTPGGSTWFDSTVLRQIAGMMSEMLIAVLGLIV